MYWHFSRVILSLFSFQAFLAPLLVPLSATADDSGCAKLPRYQRAKQALIEVRNKDNGGLNLDMWGTIVDRSGIVCSVFYTGTNVGAQWPGSRVIAAQKANTANSFSLPHLALSTANLWAGVQPGGFLYGIQESNPVNTQVAYAGSAKKYGSPSDPLVGKRIGGVNVFGGGLPLYNESGELLGGLGLSGDTSCADHNIAWQVRHLLKLDFVPAGVSSDKTDQITYDVSGTISSSGFGHPTCGNKEDKVSKSLPATSKVAAKK